MLHIFYFRNFNTLKSSCFPSLSLSSTLPPLLFPSFIVQFLLIFLSVLSVRSLIQLTVPCLCVFFATRQRNELNVHFQHIYLAPAYNSSWSPPPFHTNHLHKMSILFILSHRRRAAERKTSTRAEAHLVRAPLQRRLPQLPQRGASSLSAMLAPHFSAAVAI